MQPLVFTLQGNHTAGQALEKIKKNKGLLFQQVYVLDQNKRLEGVIELQDLLTVNDKVSIQSILNSNPTTISASMDISALKDSELWDHSFPSLPVVDIDGVFLGIISKKTLSDLIPEKKESIQSTRQTGAALGDLYRLGISSFLHGAKVLTDK